MIRLYEPGEPLVFGEEDLIMAISVPSGLNWWERFKAWLARLWYGIYKR